MAAITINTTAAHDAAIQYVLDRVNAERAAQTPPQPALTATQYLQRILADTFQSYGREALRAAARAKLTAAEAEAAGL